MTESAADYNPACANVDRALRKQLANRLRASQGRNRPSEYKAVTALTMGYLKYHTVGIPNRCGRAELA